MALCKDFRLETLRRSNPNRRAKRRFLVRKTACRPSKGYKRRRIEERGRNRGGVVGRLNRVVRTSQGKASHVLPVKNSPRFRSPKSDTNSRQHRIKSRQENKAFHHQPARRKHVNHVLGERILNLLLEIAIAFARSEI